MANCVFRCAILAENMTNKTIFVSGGVVFTGFFIHGAVCDVCVSPVKKKRRIK